MFDGCSLDFSKNGGWTSLRLKHRLPAYHRAQHLGLKQLLRDDGSDVTIKHNEVSEHARNDQTLVLLGELGEG